MAFEDLRVVVTTLGGETAELQLSSDETVHDLKLQVVQALHVPMDCQQLLIAGDIPLDSAVLGDLGEEDGEEDVLEVAVLVSLDNLLELLQAKKPLERAKALHALARVAAKDDDVVIDAVTCRLNDQSGSVRQAAVEALAKLAHPGVGSLIEALTVCFDHERSDVQSFAVGVFANVAPSGDNDAMQFLQTLFGSGSAPMREHSIRALAKVAGTGNKEVIEFVARGMADDHARVKCACLEALAMLEARSGDRDVISIIRPHMSDGDHAVRENAARALAAVAQKGDTEVMQVLLTAFDDQEYARTAVLVPSLLVSLCNPGCEFVINALAAKTKDALASPDLHMSRCILGAVLTALERLAEESGERSELIAGVAERCIEGGSWPVVIRPALRLLSKSVESTDERLVTRARRCMASSDSGERAFAIVVLFPWFAARADARTLEALAEPLRDSASHVRSAALGALDKIAEAGGEGGCLGQVSAVARPLLRDQDSKVRRNAVKLLGKVLTPRDPDLLLELRLSLSDSDARVRAQAVEVLAGLPRSDDEFLDELRTTVMGKLDDQNVAVRMAALRVAPRLAKRGDTKFIEALMANLNPSRAAGARVTKGLRGEYASRALAAAALGDVANPLPDDEQVVQALARCICERESKLRANAAASFMKLVGGQAKEEHWQPFLDVGLRGGLKTRTLVLEVLGKVVPRGDAAVTELLLEHVSQEKTSVARLAAIKALVAVAPKGHVGSLRALRKLLVTSKKEQFMEAVLEGLPALATKGEEEVVRVVMRCLNEDSPKVRLAAVEALSEVMATGDARFTQALRPCLEDPDPEVKRAAANELVIATFSATDREGQGGVCDRRLESICQGLGDWSEGEMATLRGALERDLGRKPSNEEFARWVMAP